MIDFEDITRLKDLVMPDMNKTAERLMEADREYREVREVIERKEEHFRQTRESGDLKDIFAYVDACFSYQVELSLVYYIAGLLDGNTMREKYGEDLEKLTEN